MVVDIQKAPSTPTLAERYGFCLNDAPLCTRKEMVRSKLYLILSFQCQKNPNKCRILNKSATVCLLRNTAPSRIAKIRHAPFMESPDAHLVSFVQHRGFFCSYANVF